MEATKGDSCHTKVHRVIRPSDIWLVGDGQPSTLQHGPGHRYYGTGLGYVACLIYYDWVYDLTAGGQAGGRHNGGARAGFHADVNIAFIDTHVETWAWENCYKNERNLFAHGYNSPPQWDGVYE